MTSLLLLGLLVGLASGLYYAWVVSPVVYSDASPARLADAQKAEYILLVSHSFAASGDWPQAEKRLAALDDPAIARTVATQLDQYLRRGEPALVVSDLALVAGRLGVNHPAVTLLVPQSTVAALTGTPTSITDSQTATPLSAAVLPTLPPTPSPTQAPTRTPFPTPAPTTTPLPTTVPIYRLLGQERVCDEDAPVSRIEVVVVDAFLDPLPGVEVMVQWLGGEDRFFTGFQPENGLGYGDFAMEPEVSYTVTLVEGSPIISGLRVEPCQASEGGLAGGWRLTFQNTDVLQETPTPEF